MTTITVQPPKLWKYLLGASLALIILIPLWTVFVMAIIQPASLIMQEQTMGNRLLWWVVGPVIAMALFFGWRWMAASQNMQATKPQAMQAQHAAVSDQSKREYVLEVIGLGVTLDKYRQGKLWEALQKSSPYGTIREQDKEKYPWSAQDKAGIAGGREGDALENGAQYTPMYWGVPVFNAQMPILDPSMQPKPNKPGSGMVGGAVSSGMAWHLFVTGPCRFEERPDRILEDVFAFFDINPDVLYVMLTSTDGLDLRDSTRVPGTPKLLKDGHYIPEMPDTSTLFVLARRERVDAVRPFVWDDPENKFVQNKLRWMYYDVMRAVPHPDKERNPQAHTERQPLIAEWLPAAAAFAQRPEIRGTGPTSMLDGINPWVHHPPKDWKPTPWFPIPWNKDQLATFDKLPTLGFIHRPTFVKFTDEHGKPLTRRDARAKALQDGWQTALHTLPEAERAAAPARIIAATGGNTEQLIALHHTLNDYAAQGGPEFDSGKSEQFIDTDRRLGNTGASTLFIQMAIGVMGSYREGGISAAINLRDTNEASIIFITPPSVEQRKTQHHPKGGDVFGHRGTPAIDPENYPKN